MKVRLSWKEKNRWNNLEFIGRDVKVSMSSSVKDMWIVNVDGVEWDVWVKDVKRFLVLEVDDE